MTVAESLKDRNLYSNLRRAADLSNPFWDRAVSEGLADITADRVAGFEHRTIQGYEFENFSTYSYLGLDTDDRIRSGAIAALERERTFEQFHLADESPLQPSRRHRGRVERTA